MITEMDKVYLEDWTFYSQLYYAWRQMNAMFFYLNQKQLVPSEWLIFNQKVSQNNTNAGAVCSRDTVNDFGFIRVWP